MALEGSFEKGAIVTKPLKISGNTLHLNVKANFGEAIVELLDEKGNSIAKSKSIAEDSPKIPGS